MVFRRYFFLWFSFFMACLGLVLIASLYPLWIASNRSQLAEENNLASAFRAEFAVMAPTSPLVDEWNWEDIFERFQKEHPRLQGMMLVDNVHGQPTFRKGTFPEGWEPTLETAQGTGAGWVNSSSDIRLWTVHPGGAMRPRYQLWVNVGSPPNWKDFLHEHRWFICLQVGIVVGVFLLFYWRWGNPSRFIDPLTVAVQNSLEHAETLLPLGHLNLPGEFASLEKAVSLLLEARYHDHERIEMLTQKYNHSLRQKTQYSQMIENLREYRENELSAIEAMQNTLLRINREPVIVLDRTQRILSMNEAAKRVLSLSGQTGYPLRHPEIEDVLKFLLEADRPITKTVSLRDPHLGKTTVWKVSLTLQWDSDDRKEIDRMIVSLNKEELNPQKGAPSSKDLLYLYSTAWFESWHHPGSLPTLMDEEERRLVEPLVREILCIDGERVEADELLPVFGLAVQSTLPGVRKKRMAGGTLRVWSLFEKWFSYVLSRMVSESPALDLDHYSGTRLRIQWSLSGKIPFEDWFGPRTDNTLKFRNQLIRRLLERTQSNMIWNPEKPEKVWVEFQLKAESCFPRLPKSPDPEKPQLIRAPSV